MPARVLSSAVAPVDKLALDEDDDDEVVREIDVFLSPELSSHLHLLQYPLEHGSAFASPTEARIKPQHNIIELSEPFPQNAELQGEFRHLDKRIFESQTIPVTTHLCIGKLKTTETGTALHLVPLNHISQMRPSFRHLATEEEEDPLYDEDDDDAMANHDDKAKQSKPIVFQRKETDRAASARRSSHAFMKASQESEPWVDLDVCVEGSIEYQSVIDKVYCPEPENFVIRHDDLSETAYVASLNYLPKDSVATSAADEVDIDLGSTVAQLTKLMLAGCPVPFSILQSQVSERISNRDLFTALSVCSTLVRGNFCILSKLLNLPKPMQRARKFILMLLQHETVERSRLDRAFRGKVSSERILSLLQQVGKLTADGWVLKVEEDFAFQARFPDQVRVHQSRMERQEQKFQLELKRYRMNQ